jgi:hypothetical protein
MNDAVDVKSKRKRLVAKGSASQACEEQAGGDYDDADASRVLLFLRPPLPLPDCTRNDSSSSRTTTTTTTTNRTLITD